MKHITPIGNPKVSVIMGIYNCEKTLRESADSICRQTYSNWELILWDDGSTDGTYELAQQIAGQDHDRIKLFHGEKNRKLSYALNQGCQYIFSVQFLFLHGKVRSVQLP